MCKGCSIEHGTQGCYTIAFADNVLYLKEEEKELIPSGSQE
jgi:hypothetical protein